MRPGLLCPGKGPVGAGEGGSAGAASMRPGLLCPGKENGYDAPWPPSTWLQ